MSNIETRISTTGVRRKRKFFWFMSNREAQKLLHCRTVVGGVDTNYVT